MANINEILARAAALRDETALNSISPERAGGIMYDTLIVLNELWLQQGAALVISKIYASVDAMEADTAPVSDISGKPLRPGQIVVIASEDEDNGSVYRYNGTDSPSWSVVGNIGNLEPVDSLDSDSTQLPLAAHQGKVLDGKISQLGQKVEQNIGEYGSQTIVMSPGYVACNGAAGTTVVLTPVSHATYTHAIVDCSPGTILYVQGKGGNSDRLYCFIDSENKVISSAVANLDQETPLKLYSPANTAKVIINDENTKRGSYIGEKLGILAEMAADGYSFVGVATLSTVPVTASQAKGKVFYLVSAPGTYERFGNLEVAPGRLYAFRKDFSAQSPNWYNTEVLDFRKYTNCLNVNVYNGKSDAYNNATEARNSVPGALRQKGLTYSYLLSDGWHTEQFINDDTSNWSEADNAGTIYRKDVSYDNYYMVVPFTTDIPTSRENVPFNKRKNGMIICIKDSQGVWHIEQNRGTNSISPASWRSNANWVSLYTSADVDSEVSEGSNKLITSGAVKTAIDNSLIVTEELSLAGNDYAGYISSSNVWEAAGSVIGEKYTCKMIPLPANIDKLKITAGNRECIYAFVCLTYIRTGVKPAFASGNYGRSSIPYGQTRTVDVPKDAKYVYFYNLGLNSTLIYLPASVIAITYKQTLVDVNAGNIRKMQSTNPPLPVMFDANGRDVPGNVGVLNMYKKACQMMNIPWTCLYDLPAVGDTYVRDLAGSWHGFPYSSVKEHDKFIGFNVSPRTFMTAAHNPYSLLYTEDTFDGVRTKGIAPGTGAIGGISQYGFTYHGINCGPYFGVVCNVFALTPLGFDVPWNTAEWDYLEKIGVFEKVYDQSATGVRLGDIIWESGHGNLITDIYRDQRGNPVKIYWSESTVQRNGYNIDTHDYTPEEFNDRLARGHAIDDGETYPRGIIYRYNDIYKNLQYTPSEFVAVEGEETPSPYVYNDDICTFAGDYACFYEGDTIYINYTKGSYTQMEIYKDNTLIDIKTLDADSSVHKLNLSGDNLSYGKYKARLTDGTNHSDYTYWEIVDCNVVYTDIDGDKKKVEFSSHNGTPHFIQFTYISGKSRGIYVLTDEDKARGYAEVSPRMIMNEQYDLGGSVPAQFEETTYCKVFFRGEYGVVRGMVVTDLNP